MPATYVVTITDHGLRVEGREVSPGSVLRLRAQPPAHWRRFCEIGVASDEAEPTMATGLKDDPHAPEPEEPEPEAPKAPNKPGPKPKSQGKAPKGD